MENKFVEELKWRGCLHDTTPNIPKSVVGYVGFDATADSLHVGHLAQIVTLCRLLDCGFKGFALVGTSTALIGDPSGRSSERALLDPWVVDDNAAKIKEQLERLVIGKNMERAMLGDVLTNDWLRAHNLIDFIRDYGKLFTVRYMLSKESVKSRIDEGMSFTEFTYQLLQGYDFFHLHTLKGCTLQIGGSDQWGNMITGIDLMRKKGVVEEDANAITTRLLTRSDGSKFGKSEGENIWLDPQRTPPYKFYQFWLNATDDEAAQWLRSLTFLKREQIELIEELHLGIPSKREMQKVLASEMMLFVYDSKTLDAVRAASEALFSGKIRDLDESSFMFAVDGIPQHNIQRQDVEAGLNVVDALAWSGITTSKGEAKKLVDGGGVRVNMDRIDTSFVVDGTSVLHGKYILVQRGKKNHFLLSLT